MSLACRAAERAAERTMCEMFLVCASKAMQKRDQDAELAALPEDLRSDASSHVSTDDYQKRVKIGDSAEMATVRFQIRDGKLVYMRLDDDYRFDALERTVSVTMGDTGEYGGVMRLELPRHPTWSADKQSFVERCHSMLHVLEHAFDPVRRV